MQAKPKMLVFSHICSPQYVTGAEKLLLFMMRELQPYFNCTLVVPTEGVIAQQARELGFPVVLQDVPLVVPLYLALPHLNDEIEMYQRTPAWASLITLIHQEQPNIVLVNTTVHPLPAMAAKMLGIPVVWSAMEAIRFTPDTYRSAALIEQFADVVLGISEATLAPLRTPSLLPRSLLLPPSWNPDEMTPEMWPTFREQRRSQLGLSDEHLVVGFIAASIFDAKGLDQFMRMAVDVAERFPQAMYLLVGNPVDSDYFEQCLNVARNAGLMDRFRWVRFEERIETLYPAMDVVVIPSMAAEGFGMTALEAMVFGKPIVVYGAGGLAEIAQATGNDMYVARTGDPDGLFTRVCGLLGDFKRRQAAGLHNWNAARAVYGITEYRRKLKTFVQTLAMRGFVPLRLVKGSGSTVYLYEQGILRPFRSLEALHAAGYTLEEVREVPDSLIVSLPKGPPIGSRPARARKARASRLRHRRLRKGRRLRRSTKRVIRARRRRRNIGGLLRRRRRGTLRRRSIKSGRSRRRRSARR
ncbi:glycosyltransferase involved in cell wall biosynthesis [Paenibacillus phyllosphaerae]|uniref:Glycosyltransferase involved in cell wall biosynthesis n=1 Tax=Paenibacillus phyllosphaerae TaxID=274593 RepID=A0A7W5B457_9BACL|nr:glycosyltransferase family 4 protein [Paenibacillus phyllosphaerae]MBB3113626.1 glycosyltransferase involved in cell wall biosynthesis [Paenibacillus phyllosphaerae]